MHLGRAVVTAVASIAARQLGQILPDSFCTPECPQCKSAVTNPFDTVTLCQPNSTFLVNCGSCQTCIWTYAIENPDLPGMGVLETGISNLLDLCLNTTANEEVVALQSQVSRISLLGDVLTSGHTATTTYSEFTRTITGSSSTWTITGVINPSWTTVLSTATWASYYYSEISAESVASAAAAESGQRAGASIITPAPSAPTITPSNEGTETLSKSWVLGPVIGSVLGVATVIVVIFFTRRKYLLDAMAISAAKDTKEEDDIGDDSGESTQAQSQPPSECVELRELENTEVYEMPAAEPVGSELSTPRDGTLNASEQWPLPITPLRALFAMSEIRDERAGNNTSPQHDTYYNP